MSPDWTDPPVPGETAADVKPPAAASPLTLAVTPAGRSGERKPLDRLISEREPDLAELIRERDPFMGVLSDIAVAHIEETLAAERIRRRILEERR